MPAVTHEVQNVGGFVTTIERLCRQLAVIQHNPDQSVRIEPFDLWYRGERDTTYPLRPKIYRHKRWSPDYERDLTNRFRVLSKSRHIDVPSYDNYGLFLSLMQHYRLPTRLLDWSTSPLVALYFAIEPFMYDNTAAKTDIAVWVLNPHALNQRQVGEPYTPSIEGPSVRKYIRGAFTSYYPPDLGDDYVSPDAEKFVAVMAAESDRRMFVQQGCFTVHTRPAALDEVQERESFLSKLVIPSSSIDRLVRELRLCGFRKSTIYPDLENLSHDLQVRWD